jgi:hypothetical protein
MADSSRVWLQRSIAPVQRHAVDTGGSMALWAAGILR